MMYTVSGEKYIYGEREEKQTTLNVLKARKINLGAGAGYSSLLTEHNILLLIVSGNVLLKNCRIDKGNIICISRFTRFEISVNEAADMIEITFDYSKNIELFEEKIRVVKAQPDVRATLKKIYDNNFFCNLLEGVNEGLLLDALNTMNFLLSSCPINLNLYQRCREWIEYNSNRYITAEDVAAAMKCSTAHLNRTVKKYSGKCLGTIIAEERISRIKMLTENSCLSTKEIASRLDFASSELMRKFFRYHTGTSLKDYKLKNQA